MRKYKSILVFLSILILMFITYSIFFYYIIIPNIIERRARDLNFMRYENVEDKFVPKDSLLINYWDLYYLQYGTMDK